LKLLTKELSQFVVRTGYQDLPLEAINAAKRAMLDFIGVAMAGSYEPSGKIINETIKEKGSTPEAIVIGGRFQATCSLAALANGTAGHVLDYDDCLDFPNVPLAHPSTGILPAAMAVSEKYNINGKDLLTAYLVGMEVYGKLGLIIRGSSHGNEAWEWTGVLGGMGAVAAVSKLLKLDEEKVSISFGIAATLTSGLIRSFGTMAGHLNAGHAAQNGVEAALLSQKGFSSCDCIVEAPRGFYHGFAGTAEMISDKLSSDTIKSLGNPWSIVSPGLMHKAYPCAHISHFGTGAAIQIVNRYSVDWRQVKEIHFQFPNAMRRVVAFRSPQTGVEAKFSPGYCVSRVLIDGRVRIGDFCLERINEPEIKQLLSKVKIDFNEEDQGSGAFDPHEVSIKMNNGEIYSCKVAHPKGEPSNPLNEDELIAKYYDCAEYGKYDKKTATDIKDLILNLENINSFVEVAKLLGVKH
jgi:2-methylcitrate dehydratase PrpD